MNRVGCFFQSGAAIVHAELAVGGRVPGVAVVRENGMLHAHQREQALHLAEVADGISVEAADEVDLFVGNALQFGRGAGFAIPEMLHDPLHHIVVTGDVAAHECRGVGEWHVEILRHRTLVFGILDEGVEVVANHFGHAGGGDRDHFRLVKIVGIGQPVGHVILPAEDRGVFGHRRGHARCGLLKMPGEVTAVVSYAALRPVYERQRAFKAGSREYRT